MLNSTILPRIRKAALLLLWIALVSGCSQSFYMHGRRYLAKKEYTPAIEAFYKEISANPQNARAWRELGVAFYEQGNLTKAEDALKQANNIQPDARTHLYLGLVYEKQEMYDKAVKAYTASLNLKPRGKTATLTRGHLDRLIYKKVESEIAKALESEAAIDVDTIPDNTIAVADFDASNLPPELAPIAKGLAEFTAIDLAKVHSLTVVERQKLDVLLKELQFGTSGYVDLSSAPRLGRLMGARRLITGSVLSIGDKGLKLDGAIVNTVDSATLRPQGAEGELEKFFRLQKDFVFAIIDKLGITLTAEERDAIEEVPTESYLAFLAYCRGLDYRSRGMYGMARQAFQEAVQHDQDFQQAEQQLETVADAGTLEMGYQEELDLFEKTVSEESRQGETTNGLDSRLTSVVQNVGIVPSTSGQTANEPPVTTETATVRIRGNLDAP
jgi:tetratricopeptide (TPR) repeat protein